MIVIVYSAETKDSIVTNLGGKDYSYYFVLEKYRKVLGTFTRVIKVSEPEHEVDEIYNACLAKDESCVFFSFTPPFLTLTGLKCPTISVFAWEYATIPTDTWGQNPRNDWRTVLVKHGCAITHSNFAVQAVQKAMGSDFPVWTIPAPVWDDYAKFYKKNRSVFQPRGVDLAFKGAFVDFQGCSSSSVPGEDYVNFNEVRSSQKSIKTLRLQLNGMIYTAVFNPNDGRKNWMDLLWGFCWAFRDVADVTLVMKLVYHDYEHIRALVINEILKLAPFKCRVVVLHGFLNNRQYAKLIQGSTYVVNTAHGEGQCLPLMEYMSAGVPAIAPIHTAMADYINVDNAFVVESSIECYHWPHDPRVALRTFRYRINWESLLCAFQKSYQVALNSPELYKSMSACAKESLEKYCSKQVVKAKLKSVFLEKGMVWDGWLIFFCKKTKEIITMSPHLLKTWCVQFIGNGYIRIKKIRALLPRLLLARYRLRRFF